ncbi:MAG: hypothetical protein QNJ46_21805 [Leptolyngbyaceae cyanobacterium MO_188.B28]|nr:hypothetical protein [Leptolyngbyaceae cyanobacterium MO_188.B28]
METAPPLAAIGTGTARTSLPQPAPAASDSLTHDAVTNNSLTTGALTTEDIARRTDPETLPQIAEIRTYFQQRWRAPDDLDQLLAYRLVINPEGSIQSITPISAAAETYRDLIPLPPPNELLVSPISTGDPLSVRLLFSPNSAVLVFEE